MRSGALASASATPWAALLPVLDPTTMGWRGRGFYVDKPNATTVYDSAGNGRATAIPLTGSATNALKHAAAELTARLDGDLIRSSLQSPLTPGQHRDLNR